MAVTVETFGRVTLMNCDCMGYMRSLPDKAFALAIADPPYGIGEHGGRDRSRNITRSDGTVSRHIVTKHVRRGWDEKPPEPAYFDELRRVSERQIIWGANYMPVCLRGGRIVWDKCNDGSDQSGAEIAYNSMSDRVTVFRYLWRGMHQGKSLSEGTVSQGSVRLRERPNHPAYKPVALYAWLLREFARPGDTVLDTHLGGGSIAVACLNAGFPLTACETDPCYYALARDRIARHAAQGVMGL